MIEERGGKFFFMNMFGCNALHYAARMNRTTTRLIQFLLTHMSLDGINKEDIAGETPFGYMLL